MLLRLCFPCLPRLHAVLDFLGLHDAAYRVRHSEAFHCHTTEERIAQRERLRDIRGAECKANVCIQRRACLEQERATLTASCKMRKLSKDDLDRYTAMGEEIVSVVQKYQEHRREIGRLKYQQTDGMR